MTQKLGFLDYLKAAFDARPEVPIIGPFPVNKLAVLAFIGLGFVNPGFWFLGAAGELTYLWMMSTNPRFQRLVDALHRAQPNPELGAQLQQWVDSLEGALRQRLERLNANLVEVGRLMQMGNQTPDFMWDSRCQTMNQLTVIFLKLLVNQQLIRKSLNMTSRKDLENSIRQLRIDLTPESISENLKRSLIANLEIQERRLANLDKANENLSVIEMELTRIENQAQLIREEVAFNRSPDALQASLDRVTSTLGDAEKFMNQHADFLGSLAPSNGLLDGNETMFGGTLTTPAVSGTTSGQAAPPPSQPQSQ